MRLSPMVLSLLIAAPLAAACGGVAEELPASEQEGGAPAAPGTGPIAGAGGAGNQEPTDDEVRQLIIDVSIAAYDGPCPCPYNIAADGKECGGRSAYSRQGGAEPICFPEQVTDAMVEARRNPP